MKILKKTDPLFPKTSTEKKNNQTEDLVNEEKSQLLEQVFGVIYIIFIIGITLAVLMELKMEYQIDLFPGIDTPFDDVYKEAKGSLSGESQGAPPPHD
ncbi:MAG: hypothetical protein K9H61_03790 [Bacteroidia bacterium]|nr:hypothetical protein [Bacteroidia bacterium]MCF8425327.1 hypothetical protein [Bacteroidia bacterium]MCF8446096.1 hypothetical protein [Bacteroidia bacterium]